MQVLRMPDADLAWTAEGDGPAVLLLHAGVADMRMWDPLVERLRGELKLIRFDMRGFGATRYGTQPFVLAQDAVAVLDAAGVDTATVVGNSFGGEIALEVASAFPDRVRGLVALAPASSSHEPSGELEAFAQAEDAALESGDLDEAVELNLRTWVDRSPAAAPHRALVADMQRGAFELQLATEPDARPVQIDAAAIAVPALVMVGELDLPDFAAIAERLANDLPQGALLRVAGAGHLLPLDATEAVADAVRTIACG